MMQSFGYYQFKSREIQEQIEEATYGAALMQINIRDLRKLTFVMPPLSFQSNAIKRLDIIALEIEKLRSLYREKLESLDELKKSILQKAFSGELTKNKEIAA
jgi:type I restriction enzyme S subunit